MSESPAALAGWLLTLLQTRSKVTVSEAAKQLGVTRPLARRWLTEWARQGICTKEAAPALPGHAGTWQHVYRLAPQFKGNSAS